MSLNSILVMLFGILGVACDFGGTSPGTEAGPTAEIQGLWETTSVKLTKTTWDFPTTCEYKNKEYTISTLYHYESGDFTIYLYFPNYAQEGLLAPVYSCQTEKTMQGTYKFIDKDNMDTTLAGAATGVFNVNISGDEMTLTTVPPSGYVSRSKKMATTILQDTVDDCHFAQNCMIFYKPK